VFEGELSLENNGGFASVRARLGPTDLSGFAGVSVRIRGDGRTYQLRFRLDERFDGVAYRATFESTPEWSTVVIPFESFVPTFRGRTLRDRPPLDPTAIRQLSFMIADKTAGPFHLEIDWVRAVAETKPR
jgi:monofunctional biosynthetic peptidoglycan transglycosylase